MVKLVLIRHGESQWNLENRFTGWTDVELSKTGINEAVNAGRKLKEAGFKFDVAYTSVLKRANDTLNLVLLESKQKNVVTKFNWKLNERHYGALQGLNKEETAIKYGAEQVKLWRRSIDVRPPELTKDDPRHPRLDPKYKNFAPKDLPSSENLLDTVKRVVEYWNSDISKDVKAKKSVIIAAHGNSLRALVKYLDNISNDEIMAVEIPTGKPLVYEIDELTLKPIRHYYL
jgi:2,3-bisphosphoglycerate-dependent phosphoglycerate mutase